MTFFIKAPKKLQKICTTFFKKFCHQGLLKIAQSGHTDRSHPEFETQQKKIVFYQKEESNQSRQVEVEIFYLCAVLCL